jgi:hypothetical protein
MADPKFSLKMRKGDDVRTLDVSVKGGTAIEISAADAASLGMAVEHREGALILKLDGELSMRVLGDHDFTGKGTLEHDLGSGTTSFQGGLEFEFAQGSNATIETRISPTEKSLTGTVTIHF